ncbi:MAG: hypothetical protein COZ70_06665 [Deltaproteobacteria bacterium CG_4_8_14_3_um_filter_51_11]|nr:MAG: hypothetical protein AUK25_04920 [Desulfobacteraceae bacterium CG2_30_51_40]PIX19879.1 MAG: hypothetical protein COZ70_06665 [Deltaproteobacteria bacterium CG_4_8_14_3_um_filter_51_11]PJB38169.1 MAG: hypothetical protein CO107_02860 [Deltaproteobacteria bacterium CG_4_9_14_3_um_filter_51_14]
MFLSALENNLRNRASHARMFIIVVITVLLSGLHVVFAEPPDSGIYAELLGSVHPEMAIFTDFGVGLKF